MRAGNDEKTVTGIHKSPFHQTFDPNIRDIGERNESPLSPECFAPSGQRQFLFPALGLYVTRCTSFAAFGANMVFG